MSESRQITADAKKESGRRTRRSFLVAGLGAAAGYGLYHWLDTAPGDEMVPRPLRKVLKFNAAVSRGVFDERGLAPTYDASKASALRINGNFGLKEKLDPASYKLQVVGVEGAERFPQYVKDVTAWKYKYMGDTDMPTGPEVKEAPKPGGQGAGDAGTAKTMSKGTDAGGTAHAGTKPAGAPDGGAQAGPPKAQPGEGPGPNMSPAFAAAFEAAQKANDDGKPMRGQEEAGESDSTLDPGTPGLLLTMADIEKLPRHQLVTQFKCIEGWSQIVEWGGFPMAEFIKAYPPAKNAQGKLPKYVYMETPNGDYYCGFTLEACMHPQSTLVTEMTGKPLEQLHGAPLRLHMPIKYGYKQLKRIALIAYMDEQPDDYWTKLGYDWYAGL